MITNIPNNPDAIILDMDGVLADTEPIHVEAFRVMLLEYGIKADNQFLSIQHFYKHKLYHHHL